MPAVKDEVGRSRQEACKFHGGHMIPLAPGLALPPRAVTETFGVLGVRGSGKSNAAAVLVEGFAALWKIEAHLEWFRDCEERLVARITQNPPPPPKPAAKPAAPTPARDRGSLRDALASEGVEGLSKRELKVLAALAQLEQIQRRPISNTQLAIYCGWGQNGTIAEAFGWPENGTFFNSLSKLSGLCLIDRSHRGYARASALLCPEG